MVRRQVNQPWCAGSGSKRSVPMVMATARFRSTRPVYAMIGRPMAMAAAAPCQIQSGRSNIRVRP